jgi:hypothetical protein
MRYTYKMMCNFETVTIQKILFGKGYRWVNSNQNLVYEHLDQPNSIYIDTTRKLLYTCSWEDGHITIPSLDEILDLIESDVI